MRAVAVAVESDAAWESPNTLLPPATSVVVSCQCLFRPPKNWRVHSFVMLLLCQLTDVFRKAAAVLYMLISNYHR